MRYVVKLTPHLRSFREILQINDLFSFERLNSILLYCEKFDTSIVCNSANIKINDYMINI